LNQSQWLSSSVLTLLTLENQRRIAYRMIFEGNRYRLRFFYLLIAQLSVMTT